MTISFPIKTADLEPPSSLFVTKDDTLFLLARTADVNTTEFVAVGRMMDPDGQVKPFIYRMVKPTTDRSQNQSIFNLDEGYLLAIAVGPLSAAVGELATAWVQFGIMRGGTGGVNTSEILGQGYCGKGYLVSWPPLRQQRTNEGPGRNHIALPTNPAAGAELLITVPANALWRLKLLRLKLVTSATVATRIPFLVYKDPNTNQIWFSDLGIASQLASQTTEVSFSENIRSAVYALPGGITNEIGSPLPLDVRLPPLSTIGTTTAALQAGDQYSILGIQAEEWIQP